jgi:hypothetical protein
MALLGLIAQDSTTQPVKRYASLCHSIIFRIGSAGTTGKAPDVAGKPHGGPAPESSKGWYDAALRICVY